MTFSIKDMISTVDNGQEGQNRFKMKWVNLFGCNAEVDEDAKWGAIQNADVHEATTFKGRVLVEYSMIDEKHPVMKIKDIDTKNKEY